MIAILTAVVIAVILGLWANRHILRISGGSTRLEAEKLLLVEQLLAVPKLSPCVKNKRSFPFEFPSVVIFVYIFFICVVS